MQEKMTDRGVRSPPPHCTTARDDKPIVRMAMMDRGVTSRTIVQQIQSVAYNSRTIRTIRRRLQQSGTSARRPLLRLPLTESHRGLCHQWCDERSIDNRKERHCVY
ncbi:transposable element Tc1 transposase [Trichonephila clavipes]|nr:transposable element Tc1 transposase [Trichonephila clavipes]